MRRVPDPAVLRWFSSLKSVALSAVTVEELVYGLRRKGLYEKEAWLRRFALAAARIHPVDPEDAFWAGEKRGQLAGRGIALHQADALIAAAAWRHGLVLATRNVRDFAEVGIAVLNPWEA